MPLTSDEFCLEMIALFRVQHGNNRGPQQIVPDNLQQSFIRGS